MQSQLIKKPTPRIHWLAEADTPAYRIVANPQGCTSIELLSVLIGGQYQMETAEALLSYFQGDLANIYCASAGEIAKVKGIGIQTAARIKAALSLSIAMSTTSERATIQSPADAVSFVQAEMSLLEKEHLRVMLIDVRGKLIEIVEVYVGSVNCMQVRLAEVFAPAVRRMASSIILIHNHPSHDPTPSPDDIALTRCAVQAGNLLNIDLRDHIVIGRPGWKSIKEMGLVFS